MKVKTFILFTGYVESGSFTEQIGEDRLQRSRVGGQP